MIRFFDTNGPDITEDAQRKIERLFNREDFRRVFPAEIGDIGFPPRALEQYTAALEATVDIEAIRAAQFKVVVDYGYGSTSFVMPNVLAKLGADVLAVNPYASTAGAIELRPRRARRAGRRPRRGPPAPTSAPCSTPTASTSRSSTTPARSSPTTRRCWPCCPLVGDHLARRHGRPARSPSPATPRPIAGRARRAGAAHEAVDARR